jgi:hypothetical protein
VRSNPVIFCCKNYNTTLAERCSKQIEVKKSKFIAMAAPVGSERAALEFLNEVGLFTRFSLSNLPFFSISKH